MQPNGLGTGRRWPGWTPPEQANKAKGREAEKAVSEYLNARGYTTERRRMEGSNDRGDISGIPGVVIEVKAHKAIHLSQFVDEANVESRQRQPVRRRVTWIKRRGTNRPGQLVCGDGRSHIREVPQQLSTVGKRINHDRHVSQGPPRPLPAPC